MTDFTKGYGDDVDPYRYGRPPAGPGQPWQQQPQHAPQMQQGPQRPTGKQILSAAWRLLRQDRELIALPVLGAVFGVIAFAVLFVPGLVIGLNGNGDARVPIYVFGFLGALAASMVSIFFQAALVVGAYQRADGYNPSIGSTMSGAWRLRRQILGWALFTTVVGSVIRVVEQRLGILGRILGFLGGIAWAVASFFVVPVIVAEGLGPIDALKRSAATIRQMWGSSVRTTLRFGLIQFALVLVPLALIFGGIAVAGSGSTVAGATIAVLGGIVLIALGILAGAISTYARSLIYRWATGRPVPGMDTALFAGAFSPRRRRGRR